MENKYEIRNATINDLTAFYDFFKNSISTQFPEYTENTLEYMKLHPYSFEKIENSIKNNKKIVYIAFDKDKIVGYLTANYLFGGVGFAEWLAVADNYHGKGIGTALLKVYEEKALQDGGHIIHLWTAEKNISFYQKNGFTLVGKIPHNYFGADDYFMYKTLKTAEEKNYLRDFLEEIKTK